MFQKHILSNGIRVVIEKIPYVRSVSVGIWVGIGSTNENFNNNGITHFIEHMLFKGTKSRTAKDIAESIDSLGGQLNAFTGKECTCYYTKTLDTHLPIALDVLTDMIFHSEFQPDEIEKEKGVVLEEISMYEDSPEDMAHDLLSKTVFNKHSLGMPILGTSHTVSSFTREVCLQYIEDNYSTENIVVSVAGNFEEQQLIDLLEEKFSSFHKTRAEQCIKPQHPQFLQDSSTKHKDIEQLHICIGLEGISLGSKELYPMMVMNNIFGGSMSSRLFQSIREDKGLAYSVFSYPSSYKHTGLFTIYAGINPKQLDSVMTIINQEINDLKKIGLTVDELNKSKEQLKGSYILGLESTSSRMTAIGKSELLLNKIYSPKEVLDRIDSITLDEVHAVISKVFTTGKLSTALVGRIDGEKNISEFLTF
ncbi:MAG: M16 family metallopeptidase [Bacillota bacterium]